MRKLNNKEKEEIVRLSGRGGIDDQIINNLDKLKVTYQVDGNFTKALLKVSPHTVRLGVAKRNPNDKDKNNVGLNLALVRALRSFPVKL